MKYLVAGANGSGGSNGQFGQTTTVVNVDADFVEYVVLSLHYVDPVADFHFEPDGTFSSPSPAKFKVGASATVDGNYFIDIESIHNGWIEGKDSSGVVKIQRSLPTSFYLT